MAPPQKHLAVCRSRDDPLRRKHEHASDVCVAFLLAEAHGDRVVAAAPHIYGVVLATGDDGSILCDCRALHLWRMPKDAVCEQHVDVCRRKSCDSRSLRIWLRGVFCARRGACLQRHQLGRTSSGWHLRRCASKYVSCELSVLINAKPWDNSVQDFFYFFIFFRIQSG